MSHEEKDGEGKMRGKESSIPFSDDRLDGGMTMPSRKRRKKPKEKGRNWKDRSTRRRGKGRGKRGGSQAERGGARFNRSCGGPAVPTASGGGEKEHVPFSL